MSKFKVSESDVEDGTLGICVGCGNIQDGCEPDAREYTCDDCGLDKVYGLEEALIQGLVELE